MKKRFNPYEIHVATDCDPVMFFSSASGAANSRDSKESWWDEYDVDEVNAVLALLDEPSLSKLQH